MRSPGRTRAASAAWASAPSSRADAKRLTSRMNRLARSSPSDSGAWTVVSEAQTGRSRSCMASNTWNDANGPGGERHLLQCVLQAAELREEAARSIVAGLAYRGLDGGERPAFQSNEQLATSGRQRDHAGAPVTRRSAGVDQSRGLERRGHARHTWLGHAERPRKVANGHRAPFIQRREGRQVRCRYGHSGLSEDELGLGLQSVAQTLQACTERQVAEKLHDVLHPRLPL